MHEMLLNNGINIFLAGVAVPGAFRIDHHRWPLGAAIEATGLVHAHLALTGQPERFHPILGVVAHGHSALVGTAGLAAGALVNTEKNVVEVIGWRHVWKHRENV